MRGVEPVRRPAGRFRLSRDVDVVIRTDGDVHAGLLQRATQIRAPGVSAYIGELDDKGIGDAAVVAGVVPAADPGGRAGGSGHIDVAPRIDGNALADVAGGPAEVGAPDVDAVGRQLDGEGALGGGRP